MRTLRIFLVYAIFLELAYGLALPIPCTASFADHIFRVGQDQENTSFWTQLPGQLDFTMRTLVYGTYQDVARTTQNPENDFLQIPRYLGNLELRPDIAFSSGRLDLRLKPRMNLRWLAWEEGTREGDEDLEDDWYVNEWLLRLQIDPSLYASYGKENLQWGPSYLFSPSNPFFANNGRLNPIIEIPGMDFARLVWIPRMEWTISLIANTDEGRQEFNSLEFQKTYALKLDYSGHQGSAGLVLSHEEGGEDRIGTFGVWTASDTLLLYTDFNFSRNSNSFYPVPDETSPFNASMQSKNINNSSWKSTAVFGASYTLLFGPTLTLEYLYNEAGYSDEQAELYYQLRKDASEAYTDIESLEGLALMTLGHTADPGIRFFRKNYGILRVNQNNIRNVLNLSFSWIYNIDDSSGIFHSEMEFFVGNHARCFAIGGLYTGEDNEEFGDLLHSFLILGVEYTF
ncbi:hypothetical protein HNR65_002196 [Desulfosalsimonas propionicica]|uniref:Alginate export domain-containing protein n=1 Tax=Desulfosalsimonas propionicica TaxID=332175 RepID=A0A7W0C9X5_9BACT|nr:hypothetical protein [Desulfosalsimonas propionicica]MBA2881865.1 hypothetical protein [Desulfosalsimonas propionicica]